MYLPVNEMQVNNIYLSVAYNESMSLQRLHIKSWGGLWWRLEVLVHHLLNTRFRVMTVKPPDVIIFAIS